MLIAGNQIDNFTENVLSNDKHNLLIETKKKGEKNNSMPCDL